MWPLLSPCTIINPIKSSAIITQSNIVRYCINDSRNWGRISIRCWIHKRHLIPCPNGRAMGVFVDICEKIDRVITALHCITYLLTCRHDQYGEAGFHPGQLLLGHRQQCHCQCCSCRRQRLASDNAVWWKRHQRASTYIWEITSETSQLD